ncbi:MAG: DUF1295 domain-containing protein [Gemmatimonadales bacterium]
MSPRDVYLLTASVTPLIAALVVLCWVASLVRRDSSLVDRIWGLGFVLIVHHHTTFAGEVGGTVDPLFAALVLIWGLRLTWHITRRNWGHGEDPRYAAMRARNGARWWWQSLFTVFVLQGALMLLIGLPLAATATPGALWGRVLGTLLWGVGFAFEAGGDWQLARFRADPGKPGPSARLRLLALHPPSELLRRRPAVVGLLVLRGVGRPLVDRGLPAPHDAAAPEGLRGDPARIGAAGLEAGVSGVCATDAGILPVVAAERLTAKNAVPFYVSPVDRSPFTLRGLTAAAEEASHGFRPHLRALPACRRRRHGAGLGRHHPFVGQDRLLRDARWHRLSPDGVPEE